MTTALETVALVCGRRAFRIPPLTVNFPRGRITAVIGPNGSGKTTLLKTLAGLIPPLSGRLDGTGLAAYLPPPGAVSTGVSALHLTALGRASRRRWAAGLAPNDLAAAREALDRLSVAPLAHRPFDRLSSGQQQLVLMARLFVQDAPVCLLDEPLALLDPAHAQSVETAARALADEGRVVIASTHHLPFAVRADAVLTLGGSAPSLSLPGEALAPDRLSALFGVAASACPCCGQGLS